MITELFAEFFVIDRRALGERQQTAQPVRGNVDERVFDEKLVGWNPTFGALVAQLGQAFRAPSDPA